MRRFSPQVGSLLGQIEQIFLFLWSHPRFGFDSDGHRRSERFKLHGIMAALSKTQGFLTSCLFALQQYKLGYQLDLLQQDKSLVAKQRHRDKLSNRTLNVKQIKNKSNRCNKPVNQFSVPKHINKDSFRWL